MISEREGRLFVTGAMNQQTAAELTPEGERFAVAGNFVFDLAEVAAVDSSALAVVLAWMRAAKSAGKTIHIVNAPGAFLSLASLYGVTEVLFQEQVIAS